MNQFMEYTVHQRNQHHADATPFATASTYVSLEDTDWNIMIPANVKRTRTQNVIATFHSHAKPPQDESDDVDTFGDYIKTLPDHTMATDASQICPGQQRDAEALSEK
jgi:hypothetical protein